MAQAVPSQDSMHNIMAREDQPTNEHIDTESPKAKTCRDAFPCRLFHFGTEKVKEPGWLTGI